MIGPTGCGKSSFLSGILGEMFKLNGKINVNGSISYVPQIPWIQDISVKENILFGKRFDESLYQQVLTNCSLLEDINIFPAGDSTNFGEKGVSLSIRLKQRINLARSVYQQSDIYLLDDCLCHDDEYNSKNIFDSVIGPDSILKDKVVNFRLN